MLPCHDKPEVQIVENWAKLLPWPITGKASGASTTSNILLVSSSRTAADWPLTCAVSRCTVYIATVCFHCRIQSVFNNWLVLPCHCFQLATFILGYSKSKNLCLGCEGGGSPLQLNDFGMWRPSGLFHSQQAREKIPSLIQGAVALDCLRKTGRRSNYWYHEEQITFWPPYFFSYTHCKWKPSDNGSQHTSLPMVRQCSCRALN